MTLAKISLHCILRIQIWSQTYVNLKPEKSDVNIKRVWYFYQLFFNLKVKFRAVASKWCKSMQNPAERKKGRYETLKKVKQDIRDNIFNLQHHLCSYKMTRHKPPKVNLKNNSSVYICIYIYIYIYIVFRKTTKSQFGKFLKNTVSINEWRFRPFLFKNLLFKQFYHRFSAKVTDRRPSAIFSQNYYYCYQFI